MGSVVKSKCDRGMSSRFRFDDSMDFPESWPAFDCEPPMLDRHFYRWTKRFMIYKQIDSLSFGQEMHFTKVGNIVYFIQSFTEILNVALIIAIAVNFHCRWWCLLVFWGSLWTILDSNSEFRMRHPTQPWVAWWLQGDQFTVNHLRNLLEMPCGVWCSSIGCGNRQSLHLHQTNVYVAWAEESISFGRESFHEQTSFLKLVSILGLLGFFLPFPGPERKLSLWNSHTVPCCNLWPWYTKTCLAQLGNKTKHRTLWESMIFNDR